MSASGSILLAFDAALVPAATPPITSIFLLTICTRPLQAVITKVIFIEDVSSDIVLLSKFYRYMHQNYHFLPTSQLSCSECDSIT